jgi:two-component system CheB/CheR fusion protein
MSENKSKPGPPHLIVGIGASAGGLEAFTTFFAHLPPDSGMAFVLVQHLSPDHESALPEILGRAAPIPVVSAEQDMLLEPNRVHVIPPDATLTVEDSRLVVVRPAPARSNRRPIDSFFMSLAKDQGENAVAIVLSGIGTDGSAGLTAVKEMGGLTIAQAEFDRHAMPGMPQSATATGQVDFVLPVEEMPAKLLEYRDHLALVADRKDGDGSVPTPRKSWRRSCPFCAPRPATTSRTTKRRPSPGASNAACRSCRPTPFQPMSNICAKTRPNPSFCSANC